MRKPYIMKWSIYVWPESGGKEREVAYAKRLIDFLDNAVEGDIVKFDEAEFGPTFSVIGEVYGRENFPDGSEIATSDVKAFQRARNEHGKPVFIAHTRHSSYYVFGDESRELIRFKAKAT